MLPGIAVKLIHAQFFDIRLSGRIIITKTTDKIFNTRLDTLTSDQVLNISIPR